MTLKNIKAKYPEIEYYNYNCYNLSDDKFIDCDHLNKKGAEIFSKQLYEDVFLNRRQN